VQLERADRPDAGNEKDESPRKIALALLILTAVFRVVDFRLELTRRFHSNLTRLIVA
jgi:hypothetical protein